MRRKIKRNIVLVPLLISAIISAAPSCALFSRSSITLTPASKYAVLNIVDSYLVSIANGQYTQALVLVLWGDYIRNEGKQISKEEFASKVSKSVKLWQGQRPHPLLGFDDVDVTTSGEIVTVHLKKKNEPKQEPISVSVTWIGSGWMVVNDSLFGRDGFITSKVINARS